MREATEWTEKRTIPAAVAGAVGAADSTLPACPPEARPLAAVGVALGALAVARLCGRHRGAVVAGGVGAVAGDGALHFSCAARVAALGPRADLQRVKMYATMTMLTSTAAHKRPAHTIDQL